MSKGALIVGGSVSGMQAALDLANSGIQVHLVEPSPFLGNGEGTWHGWGQSAGTTQTADAGGQAAPPTVPQHLLNTRLLEVAKNANVTVWTNTGISRAGAEAHGFHVELRQYPRYVDLTKCTACMDCIEVCPVTVPGTDHKAIYLADGAQPGCAVIDKQGKAPCSNTCPGGIHVQGYVALIAQGRFQEALDLIRQAIPFPGICGRICTHPCELNCRRAEVDEAVSIRLLKRFVADWELQQLSASQGVPGDLALGRDHSPEPDSPDAKPAPSSSPDPESKRVAVIGAGPAGLAVADNLVRRGYRVTVFEAEPVVGGMMTMGIPAYRLPREVIQREARRIENLGVEIRLETPIGPGGEYTLDDLLEKGYEAIFVGVGAHKSYRLRIPGEDLQGVVTGIELLRAINLAYQFQDDDVRTRWQAQLDSYHFGGAVTRVAVIGGGNSAMDVARSLKRLGVDDVKVLYRRTRTEMPAMPEEVEEAEHEGVPIEFLVSPVRILGNEQGSVAGLECVRMKLGEPDRSGRRRPVPIAGSEFTLELDMIVPAIGQSPDLSFLGEGHDFAITREGTFNIDRVSYMTNRPGVFAAGDAITQPVSVIDAIGSAKQAAAGIDAYLRGMEAGEVQVSAREMPISQRALAPEELVPKPRHPSPMIPMDRRLHSLVEVEMGYNAAEPEGAEMAIAEAQRCLMCGPCAECLACEAVCEPNAIRHDEHERIERLEIGAIIWADGADPALSGFEPESIAPPVGHALPDGDADLHEGNGNGRQGFHQVDPSDPLSGSAAAAQVMLALFDERQSFRHQEPKVSAGGAARIGVFICQCTGQISDIVDTSWLEAQAKTWADVAYIETLAQACSQEAADAIYQAVSHRDLNRVVLAACSCCAVDQVCYSCTYQRVRCKDNLLGRHFDPGNPLFEFVNIREQCAWIHEDDPQVATSAATAMVAAAVAKVRLSLVRPQSSLPLDNSVLILGSGPAATICQGALATQQIQTLRLRTLSGQIRQTSSHFTVVHNGSNLWQGSALILAPQDEEEHDQINDVFGPVGRQPRTRHEWGGADTHRPGVFFCDPTMDAVTCWYGRRSPDRGLAGPRARLAQCRCRPGRSQSLPRLRGLRTDLRVWRYTTAAISAQACPHYLR